MSGRRASDQIDAARAARIVEACKGNSLRFVASQYGVSLDTVKRLLREARAK